MRVEYTFGLDDVAIPYFSVESMEGPEKFFRLATLIMNVMETSLICGASNAPRDPFSVE